MHMDVNGHSHCAATKVVIHGQPLLRGFCHCTICQRFNQAPFADITLFRARDVEFADNSPVEFHAWRSPPIVLRGKCTACDQPAIEFMRLPLMPKLAIVPSASIADSALVPEPALHIFYDKRVANVDDELPKYTGYPKSELAFGRRILVALLHR